MTMETETMDTKPCAREGCPNRVAPSWTFTHKNTKAERAVLRARGIFPDKKAGACPRCIYRELRAELDIAPRDAHRRAVLEDWQWLHEQGELDPTDSLAVRARQAAPRLGYDNPESLERLLQRAAKAGELVTAA